MNGQTGVKTLNINQNINQRTDRSESITCDRYMGMVNSNRDIRVVQNEGIFVELDESKIKREREKENMSPFSLWYVYICFCVSLMTQWDCRTRLRAS